VAELERQLFSPPWTERAFQRELMNDLSYSVVLCAESVLIGYAVIWLVDLEMQMTKIAISPRFQKMGIASWTMALIMDKARQLKMADAFIEVRTSNTSAIRLYEKCGFQINGRRKDYYRAPREDALLMTAKL
jgi:ribosomal-protein-alanine N-acetyltransferase